MTFGIPKKSFPWAISLLRQWRDRLRGKPQASAAPLGLDSQQVEALRLLRQSPHWPHYQQLLETITLHHVEQLLNAQPHDRYLFQCGVVFACRRLMELPEQILAKVTELEDHANVRARVEANYERNRANAFLNTPWWDLYVRDAEPVYRQPGGNGRESGTDFADLG